MSKDPYILSDEFGKQVLTCYDARHRLFIKAYSVFITFGVGFLIYAMLLADLIRLRCEYHRLVSVSQKLAAGTIRHRLSLVVPLWLDPLKTLWRNCGGAALVFLPALGFFIIVWLVITGKFIDYEAKRLDRHLIGFYNVLYVAGALFIILGVWRILAEWMGYRTMLSTETLHPEVTEEQS